MAGPGGAGAGHVPVAGRRHGHDHRHPGDHPAARLVGHRRLLDPQRLQPRPHGPLHDDGAARRPLRPQGAVPHRGGRVQSRLARVRALADGGLDHRLPDAPGDGRGGHHPHFPDAAAARLPGPQAGARRRPVRRHQLALGLTRPHARRPADQGRRLGVDLLLQPARGSLRARLRGDRGAAAGARGAGAHGLARRGSLERRAVLPHVRPHGGQQLGLALGAGARPLRRRRDRPRPVRLVGASRPAAALRPAPVQTATVRRRRPSP